MNIAQLIFVSMIVTAASLGLIGVVLIMLAKPMPDPEEAATDADHMPRQWEDGIKYDARKRAEWEQR